MPELDVDSLKPRGVSELSSIGNRKELVGCRADSIIKDKQNMPYPVLQCVDIRYEDWLSYDDCYLTNSAIEKLKETAIYGCPMRMFWYNGQRINYPSGAEVRFPIFVNNSDDGSIRYGRLIYEAGSIFVDIACVSMATGKVRFDTYSIDSGGSAK